MSKALTFLALILSAFLGYSQSLTLPVTFEDPSQNYSFTDFGGNATSIVMDPTDPTNTVARSVKTASAQIWAGTTIGTPDGFATPIPFTATETSMNVRVWSPVAGVKIRLKVEDHNNDTISVETRAITTIAGAWETLQFDFSNEIVNTPVLNLANTYDLASIHFNYGTNGASVGADSIYYWDDVRFGNAPGTAQIDLPVTFEDSIVNYTLSDFGGNATTLVSDPVIPGNTVARSVKTPTAQLWAGTNIGTSDGFATPIPFTTTETKMNVRVWSPVAGVQIRLKAEDHQNGNISVETRATTTIAGAWEILEFDFSNEIINTPALDLSNTYDLASIHFNYGANGAAVGADSVYYWDNVKFGSAPKLELPVTFEDPFENYTLTDFGGNASTVVTDPTDPTNTVARTVKTANAQVWAGTNIGTPGGFGTKIPFTATETKMNVRVWSPVSGVQIRLKAEYHLNSNLSVETRATTTVAGAWEILEFDFSNEIINTPPLDPAYPYDLLSIHFNYGVDGASVGADSVYYWDDVYFGSAPVFEQIDLPVTFEDSLVNYSVSDFGGNATTVVLDPTNSTNTVARSVKTASAQIWAGTSIGTPEGFATPIPFTATETKMNVRVWSPAAGVPIRLKAENSIQDSISVETRATTTIAGAWETLEFDFSNEIINTPPLDPANTYNLASIHFNYGVDGASVGVDSVYYWDDVMFGPAPVGIDDLRDLALRYYPNPVTNQLFVSAADRMDQLIVLNQMGQEVMATQPNSNEQMLDLSDLSAGLYVIKVSIDNAWGTFKVVKD